MEKTKETNSQKRSTLENSHRRTDEDFEEIQLHKFLKVKKSMVSLTKSKNKDAVAWVCMGGSRRRSNFSLSAFV